MTTSDALRDDGARGFSVRRAKPDDGSFVVGLFAMPHVAAATLAFRDRASFERGLARDDVATLVVERNGAPFGCASYAIVDGWLMEICVVAVREPRLGGGAFALAHLVRLAFEELRVHRIFLEVVASNVAARALYERLGFTCEGRYREGYRGRDGRFEDLLPYGMLACDRPYAAEAAS